MKSAKNYKLKIIIPCRENTLYPLCNLPFYESISEFRDTKLGRITPIPM